MSVEAKIKQMMLEANGQPKQGSSQDASYADLGDFDNTKPNATNGKDTSKASKAGNSGDGSRPKQGSSKEATWDDLDNTKSGTTASSKMSKDTTLTAKVKGDASSMPQGSSKKATYSEDEELDDESLEDEDFDEGEDELDEEELDELSKKTLGSYVRKAGKHREHLVSTDNALRSAATVVNSATYDKGTKIARAGDDLRRDMEQERSKVQDKADKRKDGINRAVKKLTKEEVDAVFGDDLTEEFRTNAVEIFEAAVIARVNDEMINIEESLTEQYQEALDEAVNEYKETLVEKTNSYLDYIVEQWLEENKLAVEQGLRLEVMENFMEGLKTLFQENYIEVPDEKVDMLEGMQERIAELEDRLNEEINKNIEFDEMVVEARRQEVFEAVAKGLADTEIERFEKLVEGIEFADEDLYAQKLSVIRKNHFNKSMNESVSGIEIDTSGEVQMNNDVMAKYAQAISRSVKK